MESLCVQASNLLRFVGYVLLVFKIAIPLLIIAFGMFDFGKAVTSGKDDDIKKSAKTLLIRAISGIIIFFVPTIVIWLFGAVSGYDTAVQQGEASDKILWKYCKACILVPYGSECGVATMGAVD